MKKSSPFIGHAGVGSRIELLTLHEKWICRETIGSQLILVLSLATLSLFPFWILLFDAHKIHGGIFGKTVLSLCVLVSMPFFIKYFRRLIGKRRIEINLLPKTIALVSESSVIEQSLHFSEVKRFEMKIFDYVSGGTRVKNFSLTMSLVSEQKIELCTTDREKELLSILSKLNEVLALQKPTQ